MLSSIYTDRYSTDDLMKSHNSIWVVRFKPKGSSYGDMLVGVVPKLSSWLTV
jgi:hypothetical protein